MMVGRLSIRIRLTLAFTVVMAVVLAATGLLVYLRVASATDRALAQGLRTRAADVAALVKQTDTGLQEGRTARADGGFAQVLDRRGGVIDATRGILRMPLLTSSQLRQSFAHQSFFVRVIGDEHVRLLAMPTTAQGQRLVIVVAASLEPRTETLLNLRRQLLVGGPIALVLAALAGYLLAAAALRPVERMSERAATISAASPGRRLPVKSPPTRSAPGSAAGLNEDAFARLSRRAHARNASGRSCRI